MNKYQKQLNKLTRQQVKVDKDKLSQIKFTFSRGSGKSNLEFMKFSKYLMMYEFLQSKKYYRWIRKCKKKILSKGDIILC